MFIFMLSLVSLCLWFFILNIIVWFDHFVCQPQCIWGGIGIIEKPRKWEMFANWCFVRNTTVLRQMHLRFPLIQVNRLSFYFIWFDFIFVSLIFLFCFRQTLQYYCVINFLFYLIQSTNKTIISNIVFNKMISL